MSRPKKNPLTFPIWRTAADFLMVWKGLWKGVFLPAAGAKNCTPGVILSEHTEPRLARYRPNELIGLAEIELEFGLTASQVRTLRRRWSFPMPVSKGKRLHFLRHDISLWRANPPNPTDLATVLRCRSSHFKSFYDFPTHGSTVES